MKSNSINQTTNLKANRWRLWARLTLLGLAAPVLLLCGVVAWYGMREWRAATVVERRLQQIRAEGLPVDGESMEAYFLKHSSQEGTVAWNEIGVLCEGVIGGEALPVVGRGKLVDLSANPKTLAQVEDYLRRMRPVIEKVHDACELPAPVYQPTAFRGHATLLGALQQSRYIMQVMCLDAEFAVQTGDKARAMKDFESMRGIAQAFNWDIFLIGKLIYLSHEGQRWYAMARSLEADLWTAEELDQLRDLVGPPPNTAESWRRSLDGERTMWVEYFNAAIEELDAETLAEDVPLLVYLWHGPYSAQVSLLDHLRDWQNIATDDLTEFTQRGLELANAQLGRDAKRSPYFWESMPLRNNFFSYLVLRENDRRMLLTAIACKKFRLRFECWPEQLSELAQVGLKPDEWTTINSGPIGFSSEMDSLRLWNAVAKDSSRVVSIDEVDPAIFEHAGEQAGSIWGIELK